MVGEVAVFIDLENLRYGLLNHYGMEPDFRQIVDKAQKYGRPTMMRAYADFSEHPSEITRQLSMCGIEAINIPVKRSLVTKGGQQMERVKNAADMALALDMMVEAFDADTGEKEKVFLMVSGDADYMRLVTQVRNRFGQRVVICSVPESVSNDLVAAAGNETDHYETPEVESVDPEELKTAIVAMVQRGPAPLHYWSLRIIDSWCQDPRQAIPGTAQGETRRHRRTVRRGRAVPAALPRRTLRQAGVRGAAGRRTGAGVGLPLGNRPAAGPRLPRLRTRCRGRSVADPLSLQGDLCVTVWETRREVVLSLPPRWGKVRMGVNRRGRGGAEA